MRGRKPENFTTVVGVDKKHLEQLTYTLPTWVKHKPDIKENPLVVFYDKDQLTFQDVEKVTRRYHGNVTTVAWPDREGVVYEGDDSKWYNAQRYKMLAGFVHVPARTVETQMWLKLDTDTVATAGHANWVDYSWFDDYPAIVSQAWGFTKPANQMDLLDAWVAENKEDLYLLASQEPLELSPKTPESDRIRHHRIISWCGFFSTTFSRLCSQHAESTMGPCKLPVPSQDGYMWYTAERAGYPIKRMDFKSKGWEHWSTMRNVREKSALSLET